MVFANGRRSKGITLDVSETGLLACVFVPDAIAHTGRLRITLTLPTSDEVTLDADVVQARGDTLAVAFRGRLKLDTTLANAGAARRATRLAADAGPLPNAERARRRAT